jgi:hypothetical protein
MPAFINVIRAAIFMGQFDQIIYVVFYFSQQWLKDWKLSIVLRDYENEHGLWMALLGNVYLRKVLVE